MSTYYSNYVINGLQGEVCDVVGNVTKYNEDTGEPYQIEKVIGQKIKIGNITIDNDGVIKIFEESKGPNGYDAIISNDNTVFIGKILTKTDVNKPYTEIDNKFDVDGFKEVFGESPKLISVFSWG
jgi:hypothetical protein